MRALCYPDLLPHLQQGQKHADPWSLHVLPPALPSNKPSHLSAPPAYFLPFPTRVFCLTCSRVDSMLTACSLHAPCLLHPRSRSPPTCLLLTYPCPQDLLPHLQQGRQYADRLLPACFSWIIKPP